MLSMKLFLNMPFLFCCLCGLSLAHASKASVEGDKTITKVVKLLQGMLDKSKADGESDRELYAKFKCYIDDNTKEKTKEVDDLTTAIGLLESKIEALQGDNGKLSGEVAQLQAAIAENEQARDEADALRIKAKADFDAEEADLTAAVEQLGQAVDVLSAIGSDQSLQAAADHNKFMAGYGTGASLVKLRASMKQALLAASTFLVPAQREKVASFLQLADRVPFTGTYTAQSGEIVGILKQMKETFASNLEAAKSAEAAAVKAHSKFMETKLEEHGTMTESYETKQEILGDNDGDLATKKGQLDVAVVQKDEAETFLENLATMGTAKAKEFEERNMLRLNEEAAISKAISILNSDAAFHAFGKVAATSTGATGFLQLRSIHRHSVARRVASSSMSNGTVQGQQRLVASRLLQRFATHSERVRRVLLLLQASTRNPFTTVLEEISKMQKLIEKEGKLDTAQLNWCNDERATNDGNLENKIEQIDIHNGEISSLITTIEDPVTGLKAQIAETEEALETNSESQKTETTQRRDAAKTYATTIADAVEAQALLTRAISVLAKYYKALEKAELEGTALMQKKQEPPATWDAYEGQSSAGGDVIEMLEFIKEEAHKEETQAHEIESADQKAYEDSMGDLKDKEENLQSSLVTLKKSLADNELELQKQREELDVATREKVAIERYLLSIKPGCDFITTNYDMRNSNREQETAALKQAEQLLTDTPAYKAAVASADLASLGTCQDLCLGENRTKAPCEACQAGVSVPGYCAGHPGTDGC